MAMHIQHGFNSGMHLYGNGESIDIIVRNIEGRPPNREVDLEIIGIGSTYQMHLTYGDGEVTIAPGIRVEIINKEKSGICIGYGLSRKYKAVRRKYPLEDQSALEKKADP